MKVKEYEIVEKISDEENYEYEEMSFGDLLDKAGLTEDEKDDAIKQRFAVNIHHLISAETYDQIFETLNDYMTDPRLKKMNAIVLLSLKKKGRGESYTSLPPEKFKEIVDFAFKNNIRIGFDSCSCPKFLNSVSDRDDKAELEMLAEPCESCLFSFYVNANGKATPCSFTDGSPGWEDSGIEVSKDKDFVKDIWKNPRISEWRENLLKNKRCCPIYNV